MVARLRLAAAVSVLGAALAFSALGVFSASASAKPRGKVVSAKLTPKSSFTTAQATTVKLVCKFSPASKRAVFLLSTKTNAKWVKVRSVTKKGSIKTYTTTVKKLFGSKAVTAGQYRTTISADANSLTRKFTVTAVTGPSSSDESDDTGSGSTGSRSRGGGDCGEDCGDNSGGDDSGDDNGGSSAAPGAFSKTSPSNGATGQSTSLTLSWSVSSNADHYQYCVDTTDNTGANTCLETSPSKGWATASSTTATVSGLLHGKTYYWQAYAIGESGYAWADSGTWFSFTVS
jgi:hypothetical protein